ncbi:MAG: cytochrome [Sphaerisporangium sp.]|jgi:cytochrome P450|nr:cytochrome [Sphaerisporangium sp.]
MVVTHDGPAGCPVHDYPFEQPTAVDAPPQWAQLREQCPVADIRLPSGDQALLLTRYEDVKATLTDPRWTRNLDPAKGAARVSAREDGGVFASSGAMSDEDHLRWRRLLSRSFTAKRVNDLRPHIAEIAEELVAELRGGPKPADLVSVLGFPLPVRVICELLGVPHSDQARFAYWSDLRLSTTKYTQAEADAGRAEFVAYMRTHIDAKRVNPTDDLISELTTINDNDDGRLSDAELMSTAMGLLIAGHETTANMIAKMVTMLLADRGRWEALLADRGLIRTAVEEALRMDANAGFGMPRFITEDVELSDVAVQAGSTVVNSLAAANRDPEVFSDPERMDLARTPNMHLAFGAGAHSCLGQSLARTELQICLDVLLTRLPTLDLAVPVAKLTRRAGLVVGGLDELPVTW